MRRRRLNSYGVTGLIPGAHEKGRENDPQQPYLEPVQVPWLRRPSPEGKTQAREFGKLALYVR